MTEKKYTLFERVLYGCILRMKRNSTVCEP